MSDRIALFLLVAVLLAPLGCQPRRGPHYGLRRAVIQGVVGGEAHDTYMFNAAAEQVLAVEIKSDDDLAQFTVGTADFFEMADSTTLGPATAEDQGWRGVMPATGHFYVHVVAHPEAHYQLTVTFEKPDEDE